jgi:lycopene cyclase domain-containing protein
MMEYTIWAGLSVVLLAGYDLLRGERLLRRPLFWIFLAVMYTFMIPMNGWLTWRPIVIYGNGMYLGVRLGTIPVEDFLFGFSLILLTLTVWERARRRA